VAGVLGSIGWGVWRLYAAPSVFGYDPFVGYFAGGLYDEEVNIGAAFYWARLYQALWATAALAACAALLDGGRLTLRWRWPRLGVASVALLAALGGAAIGRAHARLGLWLDAGDVAQALGGEKRTAHFVLHYSPNGPFAKEIDLEAREAEFRWADLSRRFGRAPQAPVHAYLFDSPAQKRALMGAAHTMVAKPWRREVYVQHEAWPPTTLPHELAHVFAGSFGDPLLAISRRGLRINVGLIEGVAVAATWSGQPLTPHQTSRLLLDAHVIDERTLRAVMGPSFFGLNAGQAYNVAGSFCRFLWDTRGTDKLMELYRAGGGDEAYQRIYGTSFATLAGEWQKRLQLEGVPESERAVTLERLKRPSVFGRPCAHALAQQRQVAAQAAAAGDRARALATWDAICAADPGNPDFAVDALDAALAADDRQAARQRAEQLLRRHDINGVVRGHAETALGDLALLEGQVDLAASEYAKAAREPADEPTARLLTVKQLLCRWPDGPSRTAVLRFLVAPAKERDQAVDLMNLRGLVDRDPGRALYRYLLARQLLARDRFADVVEVLDRLGVVEPLPDARFDREQARIAGTARYRLGDWAGARSEFARLAGDPDANEGVRLDARDWLDRIAFAEGHTL
jgi:hypothetical protein